MAYLAKARKDDLKTLATELGLEIEEMMRAKRDEKEENDYKQKQEGLILELERMKLSMTATSTNTSAAAAEKINIQHFISRFVENSDISPYLKIFESSVLIKNNPKLCGKTSRTNYLEGWLHRLEVKDFNSLKDLVLTDQLKKRVAMEVKEHFVDIWGDIKSSPELVQKLDDYEVARGHSQFESPYPLSYYGCGKPGYVKSKCPDCNPSKGDPAHFGILRINSLSPSNRNAVFRISINEVSGTAFADSRASHSIAGETLYTILLQQGAAFEKTVISLSFADGIVTQKEVLRTFQTVILEGRKFKTPFTILPDAQNYSTLLGVDFLENAGIVLNFRKNCWNFCDDSQKSYNFVTPYHSTSVNVRPVAINNCQLREDEGQELLGSQRAELDSLLRNHHSIFEVGGEATPFIEHSINTENNPPISVPPYRMNSARKELLKKELDSLLQQGIIVECESPYASPVVLIPKPNGSMHLCIDYRKLNAQTVPDSYPLPWMGDLLNEAKPTPYMSTIDLRSGYHQVKVAAEDRDKTAFTCPFGIYKFTRMPFGLRNAPATFQRLIHKFRS
ncbi:retrovirus-related Pol polyprotein from transposon 297 [Trichonephila clavipes]|uniref:Retrovirus-related Pol polyprotein from transposon 297 n=1 Tax=Trichonephila clavipes TaxID=2585209 RepID=A0A8X6SZQ7_TRICX|nr:retrovirus-related Pol polyprotein from transposon 297 [Trichonephila clavipes]